MAMAFGSTEDRFLDEVSKLAELTLVVVDNFEYVEAAAGWLQPLLHASPHVVLLVTSRKALRDPLEYEFRLEPLATVGRDSPAVQLFTSAAGRAGSDVDTESDAVHDLCHCLDGV